jgi:hypothetical protein
MPKYIVTIPVAGSIAVATEADDEESAKKKAWEKIDAEGEKAGEFQYEFYEQLYQGNITYLDCHEIEVDEA